jgi:ABC-type dipeptide/oligopeptide/nickel transport system permease component
MKLGGAVVSLLLLVVVLGFFLFRVIPGDPVKTMHSPTDGTSGRVAIALVAVARCWAQGRTVWAWAMVW